MDSAQVCARMDEYLEALGRAGEPEQAAVGHGVNMGYKLFIERFKVESAYRDAGEEAQHEFLDKLNRTVESLEPNSGTTWGLRLFWMYALLLSQSDAGMALHYAPALEQLGRKAKAATQ